MNPLNSFFHWFMKTMMFFACVSMVYGSTIYFTDGGKLIVDKSIPIVGLGNCLMLPIGVLVGIGMLYVIAHTEQELDE